MAVICSQRCYWVTDLYIDRWTGWIDCQWLDSGAYVTVELAAVRKAGHRSTLRSSVFAFWHRANVYVRLSAFCLRIYAAS